VVIALLGTVMGLGIGLAFGWAIVEALGGQGMSTFAIPVDQLLAITVIGGVAGVAAALLPARRASKLRILGAIAMD
jgi:putative ABC transport system permease protein